MADDSEKKPSTPQDFSSTKAALFAEFDRLKKWREEQRQQFQSMQLLESQKSIRLSDESHKYFERVLESAIKSPEREPTIKAPFLESCDVSSISGKSDFNLYDTLQESSMTGHLQRCFADSSQSSSSINQNMVCDAEKSSFTDNHAFGEFTAGKNASEDKDQVKTGVSNCSTAKRPFLKKGAGLLRYMPKTAPKRPPARKKVFVASSSSPKRIMRLTPKSLKLKPAIRNTEITSEQVKHIRFEIPGDTDGADEEPSVEIPAIIKSAAHVNKSKEENKFSPLSSSSSPESYVPKDKSYDTSNSGNESLTMENRELAEFEMLENCAQNSSFNSDSSVVQKVLHGEKFKSLNSNQKYILQPCIENINGNSCKSPVVNSIFSAKFGLSKCLEEVHARKEILQRVISDINPRIQCLQKEISSCKQETLDDSDMSERCSTPIEDLNLEDRIIPSATSENDLSLASLDIPLNTSSEKNANEEMCNLDCQSCNVNGGLNDSYSTQNTLEEENSACEISDVSQQNNQDTDDRSKIREKLQELEKEIEIYQDHNKKLATTCKERNEILKKLQKEREDFDKYKEAEKKKLDAELQEERKQIRRQKDTFLRYQKLRRDNPSRKEREELNALRQEVEKLQEELKRQRIKHTSESRRLKNQLDVAEKERDSFKLENIRLEEQVQDLFTALKTRMKNNPEASSVPFDKIDEESVKAVKESRHKASDKPTEVKQLDTNLSKNSDQANLKSSADCTSKTKVCFNLADECQNDKLETIEAPTESRFETVEIPAESRFKTVEIPTESRFKTVEIPTKSRFENVEILTESRCEIQAKAKNHLPEEVCDGDYTRSRIVEKENGIPENLSTISISIDCGFKEIDHGNKIERIYASGEREIKFQSGTRKIISAEGKSTKFLFYNGDSKEIFSDKREVYKYVNGVTETHFPDGLEVTEFPNGQVQRHYPDGQKEVKFPDGTSHNIYADGSEEIHAANGSVVNLSADGTETIKFANGQREIRTATYKRREFPDGSLKIIYDSGRQETRYSDGRIRIKDKDGKIIVDTKYLGVSKG